jgi:orotate phosphoribosyltransferase
MTMGADPIAIATVLMAERQGRRLKAFSIRKAEKGHGVGGRLVGPVDPSMPVAVLEDTTTTGGAAVEAASYLLGEGFHIMQAIALVDRSGGVAGEQLSALNISHMAVVVPGDLGVGS